jgi:hypothetical protein
MLTWNAAEFADWLDAIGTVGTQPPPFQSFVFPDPNLQLGVLAQDPKQVQLHVYFILELPGQWEMDDASAEYGDRNYSGTMDLTLSRAALHQAAASVRAELQSFPRREPHA